MSPMRLIILVVAAAAAIGAVFLVRSTQSPSPAEAAAPAPAAPQVQMTKEVLVARQAIPAGKFLAADDLRWTGWPDNSPTTSMVERKASPTALEDAVGAVARLEMVEGEPLTLNKIVHPGDAGFMAALVSQGMRAVAIDINLDTAAGGFIHPNDRVDVIMTREVEGAGSSSMEAMRSETILQNIRVLAIDTAYGPPAQEGQGGAIGGSRAMLELSNADSTLLSSARRAGRLTLVLRSVADMQGYSGATATGRVYRDGLTNGAEGVRVYRNGSKSVSSVPAG
jgi:pilus assembly protein CpaB